MFTYQGRLSDGGTTANGNYDLQFALFDNAAGGNQIGETQTVNTVAVSGGIFTVTLDFGANAFPGAGRFLQISARVSGGGAFTTLAPRQPISSTPYAIRSASAATAESATNATNATTATNATQLGGVAAGQYVQSGDARLSDARAPSAGSPNYIQNSNSPQASANFNINGNGTAAGTLSGNIVNASAQYNLGGNRVLSAVGTNNTFAGIAAGTANIVGVNNSFFGNSAGAANTTGFQNSFFGSSAGASNAEGFDNSFFGVSAGFANKAGAANSFFGKQAGFANTSGNDNAFFGMAAGAANTTGTDNAFFGHSAGAANTTGDRNAFFGSSAGAANKTGTYNSFFGHLAGATNLGSFNSFFGTNSGMSNTSGRANVFFGGDTGQSNSTGDFNSFFGYRAGSSNTIGIRNIAIGYDANFATGNLTNAIAIGAYATVSQSHSLVLGGIEGLNGGTATNVGIGTSAPNARLHIGVNNGNILMGNAGCLSSHVGIGFGTSLSGCTNYSILGNGTDTVINRPMGGTLYFRENNTTQMSITPGGAVRINLPGFAGSTPLCRNASLEIASCSSSRRYKEQILDFSPGLNLLNKLRPVQFLWKADLHPDLGLVAEEVAEAEPLLVLHNQKGEIEGVKYGQLNVVLINAIKEQQSQIEALNARVRSLEKSLRQRVGNARRR